MRLRLFDRIRRLAPRRRSRVTGTALQGRHRRDQRHAAGYDPPAGPAEPAQRDPVPQRPLDVAHEERPAPGVSVTPGSPDRQPGSARGPAGSPAARVGGARVGGARARIREAPGEPAGRPAPGLPPDRYQARRAADRPAAVAADRPADVAAATQTRSDALARAAAGIPHQAGGVARPSPRNVRSALRLNLPFTTPHPLERPRTADGRRHCGSLEAIMWRQWDAALPPPPEVIEAVDRLAELPEQIKERLAAGLDAIFIGPGGVPELDEMTALRGVRLPSGQATWDACAGAYGERKIVVGSQPSPTPDVMCHEVGHALDDLDSPPGKWQSDSAEFRMLYDQCQPHLASDFHRQPGGLGRKEFFADAFAAIASGQRPALVDMLSGDTRTALRVMLYFNRRYGI
jgi:hypothetical protein